MTKDEYIKKALDTPEGRKLLAAALAAPIRAELEKAGIAKKLLFEEEYRQTHTDTYTCDPDLIDEFVKGIYKDFDMGYKEPDDFDPYHIYFDAKEATLAKNVHWADCAKRDLKESCLQFNKTLIHYMVREVTKRLIYEPEIKTDMLIVVGVNYQYIPERFVHSFRFKIEVHSELQVYWLNITPKDTKAINLEMTDMTIKCFDGVK